jgi:hypothetical protein
MSAFPRTMSGASMQTHQAEAGGADARPMAPQPVTPADAKPVQDTCEAAEGLSNAELAEATLRATMACVRAVVDGISRIASAVAKDDAEAGMDGACRLTEEPDGIGKLMMAAGATNLVTIEGFRQLSHLRAEEAAVPGTQTVYPPGQGPYAESSGTNSVDRERPYPSLETREAIRRAIKEDEERNT